MSKISLKAGVLVQGATSLKKFFPIVAFGSRPVIAPSIALYFRIFPLAADHTSEKNSEASRAAHLPTRAEVAIRPPTSAIRLGVQSGRAAIENPHARHFEDRLFYSMPAL